MFVFFADGFYNLWMLDTPYYLEDLTRIWGQATQHGLWNYFDGEARFLTGLRTASDKKNFNNRIYFNQITIDDLLFIFYIYGFGNVFGILVLLVEMLINCRNITK